MVHPGRWPGRYSRRSAVYCRSRRDDGEDFEFDEEELGQDLEPDEEEWCGPRDEVDRRGSPATPNH